MKIIGWIIIFFISLFFSIATIKGSLVTLLLGIPIIWFGIKHIIHNKAYFSAIPALLTVWVTTISILDRLSSSPIPDILVIAFLFVTSFILAYVSFYTQRKLFNKEIRVKYTVKKEPDTLNTKLEKLDEKINMRKEMIKKYGWKEGIFASEIITEKEQQENSLDFVLGHEVLLEKERELEVQ